MIKQAQIKSFLNSSDAHAPLSLFSFFLINSISLSLSLSLVIVL